MRLGGTAEREERGGGVRSITERREGEIEMCGASYVREGVRVFHNYKTRVFFLFLGSFSFNLLISLQLGLVNQA